MDSERLKQLESSRIDTAVSVAKGILGAIPLGGALFAEIIGVTVPNQRLDRVIHFLIELDRRLNALEREALRSDKYAIDLFQDALIQASRALTNDRNIYIAILLKNTLRAGVVSHATKKKLLHILEELTDEDISILITINDRGYQEAAPKRNAEYLSISAYKQLGAAEQHAYLSEHIAWPLHIDTLERMGLIHVERERRGDDLALNDVDGQRGILAPVRCVLSRLGKLLLMSIDDQQL